MSEVDPQKSRKEARPVGIHLLEETDGGSMFSLSSLLSTSTAGLKEGRESRKGSRGSLLEERKKPPAVEVARDSTSEGVRRPEKQTLCWKNLFDLLEGPQGGNADTGRDQGQSEENAQNKPTKEVEEERNQCSGLELVKSELNMESLGEDEEECEGFEPSASAAKRLNLIEKRLLEVVPVKEWDQKNLYFSFGGDENENLEAIEDKRSELSRSGKHRFIQKGSTNRNSVNSNISQISGASRLSECSGFWSRRSNADGGTSAASSNAGLGKATRETGPRDPFLKGFFDSRRAKNQEILLDSRLSELRAREAHPQKLTEEQLKALIFEATLNMEDLKEAQKG